MKKTRLFRFATALGLLSALLAVPAQGWAQAISAGAPAAAAGPHLGGEIIISNLDNEKYLPSVAYNSNHDEYLVVWQNKWPGNRDIYAWRVSSRGQLLSWFAIAPGPGGNSYDRAQASVAYDPINDRYLVVFIHDVFGDGSDWDIGGRFIPWNGPSASLTEFPINTWNSSQWNPKVVYALAQQEFLVTWTNTSSGVPAYVSAARLNTGSGAVINSFTISSGTENRINPDVAYNLARNEYLVVWEKVGGNSDIYGLRLTGNGISLGGGEFAIAGWPDSEGTPSVAACNIADQYLVAWQSLVIPPTDYDTYVRYVNGDGVPGNVYPIDATTAPEVEVDVSCNQGGRQYLLAWQTMYAGGYYGVWGRLAYPNETMDPSFGIVGPGASADRTQPAIAGGYTNYLVAWEHDRDGTAYQDIHGRLVTPYTLFLPLVIK